MINIVMVTKASNIRRRRLSIVPRITFSSEGDDRLTGWSRV